MVRSSAAVVAAARRLVVARDDWKCARCGRDVRTLPFRSIQHRKAKGMGGALGLDVASNLIQMCGSGTTGCHGFVTGASGLDSWGVRWRGWAIPTTSGNNPLVVPCYLAWLHGWVLLDDDGGFEQIEPPERDVD